MSKSIYDKLNLINQETDKIKVMLVNSKQLTAEEATLENIPPAIQTLIEAGGGSVEANPYEQLYMQRTANETSMIGLFSYTPASTTLDLSKINTSKVTDMSYMFSNCKAPYLDLSGFDVSNVTSMERMFNYCTSEINIDGWDTSKLTNANYMFYYFTNGGKYLDLSALDFSNVTKVTNMFYECNVDNIDIRNINIDLTKLDWSAYSGPGLFDHVKGTTLDLSNWILDSSMTNLKYLCEWCNCTEINLTNWKTTNVINMQNMFYYNSNLIRLIIPDWDMTNVTNTSSFFYNCSKLNYIDLSRSNDATIAKIATLVPAQKLATYGQMIIPVDSSQANIEALAAKYWKPVGPRIDMTSCEIVTELDEIKPGKTAKFYYSNQEPWYANDANVEYVSSDETIATIDKESKTITSTGIEGTTEIIARIIDTQEVIGSKAFVVSEEDHYPNVIKFRGPSTPDSNNYIYVNGTSSSNKVLLSKMNYDAVFDVYTYDVGAPITSIIFNGSTVSYLNTCTDVIKINTSNMTSMKYMFTYCNKLITLDLSNFNTSNVTDMQSMFTNCSNLTSIDLSNFDTSKVTNMAGMFSYCNKLITLDLSNFNTSNVTDMDYMFSNCTKLHTLRLDNCSNATISKIIKSYNFPTNAITGVTRKIYCKEENAAGLTPPTNWVFEYVKEEPDPYVSGQFKGNTEITEVNTIVTSEHTDLLDMFQGCTNLTTVDASDWDTSNVTSMERMFSSCRSLTELDLSDLNTSQVTNMQNMFSGCSNLISLDLSNFDMSNVASKTSSMFAACTSLQTLRLDNCSYDTINKIITSYLFPTKVINGVTRKIYCKEKNARGLVAPTNWVFEFIE